MINSLLKAEKSTTKPPSIIKILGCFFFILCFGSHAFAFQTKTDSLKVQKIITKLRKQKKAPLLMQTNVVEDIDFIKKYIKAKTTVLKEKEQIVDESNAQRLGIRYKNGDTSTIPEIVKLIESRDKHKIRVLFNDLKLDYSLRDKSLPLDIEIKNAIFKLLEVPEFEAQMVQFLGYNRVEGSLPIFEEKLLSGKSNNEGRLFFWLARDGQREKPINYAVQVIENYKEGELYWVSSGLNDYLEKGSQLTKNKIVNAAKTYLKNNPLNDEDIKSIYGDYLSSGKEFKLNLYDILLTYGDENCIPLIEDLKAQSLKHAENKEARKEILENFDFRLFRFKTTIEKKSFLIKHLKNGTNFQEASNLVMSNPQFKNDEDLLNAMFYGITKFQFEDYHKEQFFDHTSNLSSELFLKYLNNVKLDDHFKKKFISHYKSYTETLEEKYAYLLDIGLVEEPFSEEKINNYKNTEDYEYDKNSILASLKMANISFGYDMEPSIIPVDYDVLLGNYINISRGKLDGISYLLETKIDEKNYKVYYQFLVVVDDTCFIMIPEDFGDWYDIETFNKLLDNILTKRQLQEIFAVVDGGQYVEIIFGNSKAIEQLFKKYKLD